MIAGRMATAGRYHRDEVGIPTSDLTAQNAADLLKAGQVGGGHEKAGAQICVSDAAKLLNVSRTPL